jgi:AcrR family transcriptional regulator
MELRNEPLQKRSEARLAAIEAAAEQAIATVGIDRFSTKDVAELAGCSIGTVYWYFPDRVAILDRLRPHRHDAAIRLERVEQLAKSYAIAARATGHVDDERRYLDLVLIATGEA